METDEFNDLVNQFAKLSNSQRKQAGLKLQSFNETSLEGVPEVLQDSVADYCPHCNSPELIKWGQASGMQRWRCKECEKTFNILTKTPLANLRKKEKWLENAQAMMDGLTLKKTAEKCDIHINTAHRWRLRITEMLGKTQCERLSGITESDVTFFYESQKGSRSINRKARRRGGDKIPKGKGDHLISVITLVDRFGHGAEKIAEDSVRDHAFDLYSSRLDSKAVLLTDGDPTLIAAMKDVNQAINEAADQRNPLKHQSLVGAKDSRGKVGGPLHIQTVNSQHSHLKRWMGRFYGVATKYLGNYVGWFRHLSENHHLNNPNLLLGLVINPQTINRQLIVTI